MSPFTRENYIDAIKNALSYLKAQVELNNAINKYSINIEAETFYAGFLNVVYGFRLKNGNHTERNIPSIDLYEECRRDDGQRVAVQVTSNNSAKKVKKTLESFCTYDYQKDYTRLIILMITEKKNYRSAFSFPADIGILFDQNRDILDVYDLLKDIEQIDDTYRLRNIYDYLVKELPSWIIGIGDTEDHRSGGKGLYARLFSIFENDRKNHPSIRMMDPDPLLFPKGLPEILSDGRYAIEEKEDARAIRDMISDSWKREDRRHILLVGEGGIGKTVAMLTLPEEDWFRKLGIPVIYVPLQRLDAFKGDLNRYIREKIGSDNYDRCIELANSSPEGHPRLLLLLDGFNEIPDKYKKDASKYLREWMERLGVQIITTSRLGFFLENGFSKYRLQPLPHDTVKSFLLSAGIVERQLPEQNDRIWEVINVPLMLTLYTQIEKVKEIANNSSAASNLEWRKPDNAAHIIWDYLQMELYRCIELDDSTYSVIHYAAAILAVAPYVCCRMGHCHKYYIDIEEFQCLVREALSFYAAHQNLLGRQMMNLCRKYDPYHEEDLFKKEEAMKYTKILINNRALFQQEICKKGIGNDEVIEYLCSLMHQNFRDALAAFFICSCLTKTHGTKEKSALLDQADYYVKDYMAEHLYDRELASIWNRHRQEEPEDGQISFILMDLIGRQRKYDYRELDFSGLDLTGTNLHRLLSKRLDICPLPGNRNKLNNTKISFDCLSPNGHAGQIESVSFSPDGRQLASCGIDSKVRIWDLENGKSCVLEGHTDRVWSVSFGSDGRRLASGSDDHTVRIWNLEGGESSILEGHTGAVYCVAFSPDGRHVASGSKDKTVRIWDIVSGENRILKGHTDGVRSVSFSSDGMLLASGAYDSTVRVWDFVSGESHVLEGHTDRVRAVSFSPDGRQLASGSDDHTVRIWNLENSENRVLEDYIDWGFSVSFSPDGRQLACGGLFDGTVQICDIESEESYMLEGHTYWVRSVSFSPDGRQLASGSDDSTIRIWDLESGESRVLEGDTGWLNSVAFSPDGRQLAGGADDSTVRIWDMESGESHVLGGHAGAIHSVSFSSDGRHLASGGSAAVRIWELETGENHVLEGDTGWVNSVTFSPDGKLLAGSGSDAAVWIWELENGESYALEGHKYWVNSVTFSPDGRQLASGSDDNTVRIWELKSGESRVLEGHSDRVRSVAFSPDGRYLASGANDSTARIWDIESGESRILEHHFGRVNSVAFSPCGRQLASASSDRMVRIWDLESGESHVLEGHSDGVNSVAFSPDGRQLASGSFDGTVRIWNLDEYQEVAKYALISHINLYKTNFELAIIDEKDKEKLRAVGAKV